MDKEKNDGIQKQDLLALNTKDKCTLTQRLVRMSWAKSLLFLLLIVLTVIGCCKAFMLILFLSHHTFTDINVDVYTSAVGLCSSQSVPAEDLGQNSKESLTNHISLRYGTSATVF